MQSTFWINRGSWQSDTHDYVYLARAVLRVGKALFPEEWRDTDPAHQLPLRPKKPGIWSVTGGTVESRKRARERARSEWENFSEEEFEQKKDRALRALLRFQRVMETIAAEAERPESLLRMAYQPKGGFGFENIPREWWQVSQIAPRFYYCQINSSEPASTAVGGTGPNWGHIFVHGKDLDAWIARLGERSEIEGISEHRPVSRPAARQPFDHSAPSRPDDAKCRELAAWFDGQGIPKREVKSTMIAARWQRADGPVPKKDAITREMKGGSKGRPGKA